MKDGRGKMAAATDAAAGVGDGIGIGPGTRVGPEVVDGVEPFIDKPEVGRRTGMRPRTIDDWMKRGFLPYYKLGRSVRFKWSEVEARLRERCRVLQEECLRSKRAER